MVTDAALAAVSADVSTPLDLDEAGEASDDARPHIGNDYVQIFADDDDCSDGDGELNDAGKTQQQGSARIGLPLQEQHDMPQKKIKKICATGWSAGTGRPWLMLFLQQ